MNYFFKKPAAVKLYVTCLKLFNDKLIFFKVNFSGMDREKEEDCIPLNPGSAIVLVFSGPNPITLM